MMRITRLAWTLLLLFTSPALAQSIAGNGGNGIGGNPTSGGGTGSPGGSSGQIQYNNAGAFGGLASTGTGSVVRATSPTVSGLTDSTGSSLAGLTLSAITGSTQCLNVNTSGVVSGTGSTCGGGGGTPGGSTGQIQYNNAGSFGGTTTGAGVLTLLGQTPSGTGGLVGKSGATIDGATIGGTTPGAGSFTTLSASSTVTFPSSATITSGTFNATNANGFEANGVPIFRVSTATTAPSIFLGPYSGASQPGNALLLDAFGVSVFESSTGAAPESSGFGSGVGIAVTTSGGMTAFGTSACASQTTGTCTAFGGDAERDLSTTGNGDIAIGPGVLSDGNDNGDIVAIGSGPMKGAQSTITIGGVITTGDVLHFTISTANACNGTSITINCTNGTLPNINYTVSAGDSTLAILTQSVLSALNTGWNPSTAINYVLGDGVQQSTVSLINVSFKTPDTTNHPTVILGHYPANWQLTIASTCTGTCGETVSIGPGFTGSKDIAIGTNVMANAGLTAPEYVVAIGYAIFDFNAVSPQNDVIVGDQVGSYCISCNDNAIVGNFTGSLSNATVLTQEAILGNNGGYGLNGGIRNTILGDETTAGSSCITTGSNNLEVSQGACVPSASTSNQMSIMNIVYGTGNSGTGSTLSTGAVGIANNAPTATFTVGDAGGNSVQGAHIAVVQTTAPTITAGTATLDAHASDVSGTVTEGTTQTGFTLTFNKAFATTPHCIVSGTAAATTITPSTTTLIIANASATGDVFNYACFQ